MTELTYGHPGQDLPAEVTLKSAWFMMKQRIIFGLYTHLDLRYGEKTVILEDISPAVLLVTSICLRK